MKDILVIDDFKPVVVFQSGYYISSMQHGCLHDFYKIT